MWEIQSGVNARHCHRGRDPGTLWVAEDYQKRASRRNSTLCGAVVGGGGNPPRLQGRGEVRPPHQGFLCKPGHAGSSVVANDTGKTYMRELRGGGPDTAVRSSTACRETSRNGATSQSLSVLVAFTALSTVPGRGAGLADLGGGQRTQLAQQRAGRRPSSQKRICEHTQNLSPDLYKSGSMHVVRQKRFNRALRNGP